MSTPTTFVPATAAPSTFQGYVRADGRAGTRNHIGVFVVGNCGATAARKVAEHFSAKRLRPFPNVDGVVPFIHELGCGMEMTGEPMNLLRRTIGGTIRNPNIVGALVIALGCERNNIRGFLEQERLELGPMLHMVVLQEIGGTANAIAAGIEAVESMLPAANACHREAVSAEHLVLGLQSAGTDRQTATGADMALGVAADLLVQHGGTVILSDTTDLAAAESAARGRAATPQVEEALVRRIEWWRGHTAGRDTRMTRQSQGVRGAADGNGLRRAGNAKVQAVYEYAHPVTQRGLVFMDAPAYAAVSATGQVAAGANVLALTTASGSGFGAAPVPTLKLAGSTAVYKRMEDDLDLDCGPVDEGVTTAQAMGLRIYERLLAHASGDATRSEELGVGDNEFVPWPIGVLA